jgi:hypothetical protein
MQAGKQAESPELFTTACASCIQPCRLPGRQLVYRLRLSGYLQGTDVVVDGSLAACSAALDMSAYNQHESTELAGLAGLICAV